MLTIPGHKRNANLNHNKILPHPCYNGYHQEHQQQQTLGRMRGKGKLINCWCKCKLAQPVWRTMWRPLKKLNIDLPYDLAIPLLGIYPKECNSSYNISIHASMFIYNSKAMETAKMPQN
jgi:hypothetical protein